MKFKDYFKEGKGVMIYRALPLNAPDAFRANDYVTKSEKFALDHAETSSIYNGEDYKVIGAVIDDSLIKPANNPGEFLMTQDIGGRALWNVILDDNTMTVKRKRV
jgi:hypothetical protein